MSQKASYFDCGTVLDDAIEKMLTLCKHSGNLGWVHREYLNDPLIKQLWEDERGEGDVGRYSGEWKASKKFGLSRTRTKLVSNLNHDDMQAALDNDIQAVAREFGK